VTGLAQEIVLRTRLGYFSVVMATGIVSVALRLADWPLLSAVLLAIAAAAFTGLAAASVLRAAASPAGLRADLACAKSAFTSFAFVAACDVLGDRLTGDGHDDAASALAAAALAAWLALTWLVPARVAARRGGPRQITDIGGSWYLWAVGVQSLAIAATFLRTGHVIPAQAAVLAGLAAWSAGVAAYLAVSGLVAVRLLRAGLGPQQPTAPYWVAMGAASITVLAAAQILRVPGSAAAAIRPALTALAVGFWLLASVLILPLVARGAWRHLLRGQPLGYRSDLWMIVFPAGMYATASMQLGTAARLPLIHAVGQSAAWPAAATWALTAAAFLATLTKPGRQRPALRP
jgi:tellurite resistance protein TehA-like permease